MSHQKFDLSLSEIELARHELSQYLSPSPLIRNSWLSNYFKCDVYLKMENMHPIGTFKIRGATYKISKLTAKEKRKGVICASAGNHAQGVAWGSKVLGANALIVMPKSAPLTKVQNTIALGAQVELIGETYDEAFAAAKKIAKKTGRTYVHAFEDLDVIAGQGTVGLEILDQLPDVDFVVGAIGGGGLMAGIGTAIKELKPDTQLIGCQAIGADSMVQSIKKGHAICLKSVNTFADGIAVADASEKMRRILKNRVDRFLETDDESIAAAVLTLMEKAKTVTEGACAVTLACLDQISKQIKGKKVVLVLGGGNIDVNLLSRIIDRGLIQAGRRIRVDVWLRDRPGSLAKLTDLIAKQGANVLQAIHDRSEPSTKIDETEVNLTLETKGPEHSAEVIKALQKIVQKLEILA